MLLFQILISSKDGLPGQSSMYTAELLAIQLALGVAHNSNKDKYVICVDSLSCLQGGRRSPAAACWAYDHWVAGSNLLSGKFRH